MRLKDHLEIISNPVAMRVEERDGTVLYTGYRGCFEFDQHEEILERKVDKFRVKIEGKRRTGGEDKLEITELNCGTFNYADLHLKIVYVYILA